MPLVTVVPDFAVNTDKVESVHYVEGTDDYKEKHVIINFKEYGHEFDPSYTLDEICAALDGKCYYRPQYDEMVGTIEVCVLHGNNSKHDEDVFGPYRLCLTQDPYATYKDIFDLRRVTHQPDISQSWEYQKMDHDRETAAFLEKLETEPPVVIFPDNYPYEQDVPNKRSFWDRVFGRL